MSDQGRVIVVSGVTRGLGRALAIELSAAGHRIAGCGRSADLFRRLGDELAGEHLLEAADVARDDQARRFATSALETFGPPDLLVNNAGIINAPTPLWEVDTAEMEAILAVNVAGTASMIRHFLPAMIERGKGVVVNLSSGWGRSTAPGMGPYCASKWAVEGLTGCLAADLPPGLAAVSLNPGIIDTDMLRKCWAADAAGYPSPAEWAAAAAPMLLSLDARQNGARLTVPL